MFRDSLQKRLQEMERENPSSSLETAKPTLKERIGFLRRYFSKAVEQVLQRNSIYGSLDNQLNDYKKAVEFEGHTGQGQYWVNEAFNNARSGEVWDDIETDLTIARGQTGFAGSMSFELMQKLQTLYSEGIKAEGPNKARHWVNEAFNDAGSGEVWEDIEADLTIARRYASEAEFPLEVDMDSLRKIYKQGIKLHGPEKVNYWRQMAANELKRGDSIDRIETSLMIARKYAREVGIKFSY